MRVYEVNSANTSQHAGPYEIGQIISLTWGAQAGAVLTVQGPDPSVGLYEATPDDRQCDDSGQPADIQGGSRWYDRGKTTTFTGTLGSPAARVVEAVVCTQRPIGDVYDDRIADLAELTEQVRNQGVEVNLPSNGRQAQRSDAPAMDEYAMGLHSTLPPATTTRTPDQFGRWYTYALSDLPTTATMMHLHLASVSANAELHRDNMTALRDASDFAGLIAYDFTTGWPEPPTPPA